MVGILFVTTKEIPMNILFHKIHMTLTTRNFLMIVGFRAIGIRPASMSFGNMFFTTNFKSKTKTISRSLYRLLSTTASSPGRFERKSPLASL